MCLTVKKGCKIEIAKEDITTYKYIHDGEDYWCGIFYPHPRFLYNEIQKAKYLLKDLEHLQREKCGDGLIISGGFHSHIKEGMNRGIFSFEKVICIIPEGSEYCFGDDNDIVSNQIIVFKTKEDYDKYIASKISSD